MTPIERAATKALARCRFVPGTHVKRFASDMAARGDSYCLSAGQSGYLWAMCHKFRRQLPPEIVAEAEQRLDPDVGQRAVSKPSAKLVFGQRERA